jgi:hypothetical protein
MEFNFDGIEDVVRSYEKGFEYAIQKKPKHF